MSDRNSRRSAARPPFGATFALALLALVLGCGPEEPASPPADPGAAGTPRPEPPTQRKTLIFESVTADLGVVHQGDEVSLEFPYRNLSGRDVHVRSFKGSCKCVLAELDTDVIPAGAEGVAKVTFRSAGRHGRETASAHLRSDAPDADPIVLTLSVETKVPLDPTQTVVNLEHREPGDRVEDRVGVRLDPEVVEWSARSLAEGLQVSNEDAGDHKGWLDYALTIPDAVGTHAFDLVLEGTLGPPYEGKAVRKPMMITWQVLPPVRANPQRLTLTKDEKATLRLQQQWERVPVSIEVRSNCAALVVEVLRTRDRTTVVEVSCADLAALPEDAAVIVSTGAASAPDLLVPVGR